MTTHQTTRRARRSLRDRLGTRLTLAVLVALPVTVATGLLAVLVESEWDPFRSLDQRTADRLHTQAIAHPLWTRLMADVSNFGGPTTWRVLVGVIAIMLWLRGARRLALWAAATMAAGAVVDTVVKAVVNRTRPALPHPVAHAPGASFPSGHALTAAVGCGVIVLILLPVLGRVATVVAWTVAGLITVAVGYSRIALGVHWVTDVVGGWLLAVGLLAGMTSAFETWRSEHGLRRTRPATEGVAPEESAKAVVAEGGLPAKESTTPTVADGEKRDRS